MKTLLRSCSSSVLALMAAPAFAQTPSGSAAPAVPIEEIVVTAQRRDQRQQDVPISISTVTAAAAERQGVTGTETLGIAVPALQFGRQTGNGGAPYIRGIGTQQAQAGVESPVAVYLDDVYMGAPNATLMQFSNIERVEVLKGPQGTLFGRNATGGVVHIHTRKPSHERAADAQIGYGRGYAGSYSYMTNLYVTGGLSDTVAANFAFAGQDQPKGYGRNLITGEDTLKAWNVGFMGRLAWEPSASTDLLLGVDYDKHDGDLGMSVFIAPGTVGTGGARFVDRFGTYDFDDRTPGETWGVNAKLSHDFGPLNFVSISGFRYSTHCLNLTVDGSPGLGVQRIGCFTPPANLNLPTADGPETRNFSQEFQFLSPTRGPFTWIGGLFYYHQRVESGHGGTRGSSVPVTGFRVGTESISTLKSYAGFADATYEFLKDTRVTAGLRYTNDVRDVVRVRPLLDDSSDLSKWTYRAILDRKITPDILAYASYSTGYKSGGFNAPLISPTGVVTLTPPIEPENLTAYEAGFKSQWFNRTLTLNASVFHYKYENLQVQQIVAGNSITLNAANARMNGADIDWNFVASKNLHLSGAFAFLDAKFTTFPGGPLFVPRPAVCTPTPMTTGPLTGGNLTCPVDMSGNRPPRAPKLTMTLSGTYTWPTDVGTFAANATLYHNSGFFWEPDNRFTQPKYDLVNTFVSWTTPNKKYEVKLYVRNLLNEYYYSYYSEGGLRDAGSAAPPRNYGIQFRAFF